MNIDTREIALELQRDHRVYDDIFVLDPKDLKVRVQEQRGALRIQFDCNVPGVSIDIAHEDEGYDLCVLLDLYLSQKLGQKIGRIDLKSNHKQVVAIVPLLGPQESFEAKHPMRQLVEDVVGRNQKK